MAQSIWTKGRWQSSARKVAMAAQNALELIQVGRLSQPYSAGFDVLHSESRYSLRRYRGTLAANTEVSAPLLLIPPLMITAEIYDISAELSAATTLVRDGVDVWVCDFRAPEKEEGGLSRTLDDHVMAVSDAIDKIRDITRRDVHLAGYSQGGMFAYQCAAYRRNEGLASVITFGSPVDIHRSVPGFSDAFAEKVAGGMRAVLGGPISRVEGLPATLSSLGFKLMGMRKEVSQIAEFLSKLHDRQALEQREAKRLFLRGDGFVAWPGPALRTFIDEFIVANRMATGGFVIDGKTLTLADITCPILCFVGLRDEMASPEAVRAIHEAAPNAQVSEVSVRAGHFGLVVGSVSLSRTWPTVRDWIRWHDGTGEAPAAIGEEPAEPTSSPVTAEEAQGDVELALDVVNKLARSAFHRASEAAQQLSDSADTLRYQMPRLRRLRSIEQGSRISFSLALLEQADSVPEQTFFLWKGRAFSYKASNIRVDNIVKGLIACGVLPTQRVGVLMQGRPSYLSMVGALNRIGAVAVLLDPSFSDAVLKDAIEVAEVAILVVDPENSCQAAKNFDGEILAIGGASGERELAKGVVDMEAIDPEAVKVPSWYTANPGRARDLAMVIVSQDAKGKARALLVSNRRWAFSAYGAAAGAILTAKDTVYCCLPLHHAAGTMVAVGSALVGGARLALADGFSPDTFWDETRRYGATVVFYAGEMCRALVDAPHTRSENGHSIRLFAGSGMRVSVWQRLVERFGPLGVLEFYASTESNAVLVNASGSKIGAVGTPLPGSAQIALLRYDLAQGELAQDEQGRHSPCSANEIGLLVSKVGAGELSETRDARILRNVFSTGDCWYSSKSLLKRDEEGDFWFVERLGDLVNSPAGTLLCYPVEELLYENPAVA
ncbi:MAG: alpha/beta fold hydrolase, partial [Kofleriaceae bacterium]|nr:alpha/beta fold hydrolase [Kofleriaceae bacterium]